jgi:hypothetical protein
MRSIWNAVGLNGRIGSAGRRSALRLETGQQQLEGGAHDLRHPRLVDHECRL